jgi:hypothetical protein
LSLTSRSAPAPTQVACAPQAFTRCLAPPSLTTSTRKRSLETCSSASLSTPLVKSSSFCVERRAIICGASHIGLRDSSVQWRHSIYIPILAAVPGIATAADFSTPAAALHEHQTARVQRNIEHFLSTISFKQEAIEILQATSPKDAVPDESAVQHLAVERENELREHLERDGFKPDYLATCKVITTWHVSDTVVRFPLSCSSGSGSLTFTIRLVRVADGWRVVRNSQ